jgi:hypothetical protein
LKIREEVFGHFKQLFAELPKSPIVKELRENLEKNGYGLENFSFEPRISLGFGNHIKFLEDRDGFFIYSIPLPKIDSEAFQISASLTILTRLLRLFDLEAQTQCELTQQLTFITNTDIGIYGGSIAGKISIPLRCYLNRMSHKQNERLRVSVELAMTKAWRSMYGKVSFCEKTRLSFKLRENGFFHLDCPGDACGLDPCDSYQNTLDQGYELCPHNTDSPKQQLTLLAGLAALCSQAEKS